MIDSILPTTAYTRVAGDYLAYQVVGSGPRDLVYLAGLTSQIDLRWEFPPMAAFLRRLASFNRLVTFDRRGFGASDPVPSGVLTWQEWAEDALAVMDAAGSRSAVLFAENDASPTALLLAATYPERISALVIAGGGARYLASEDFEGVAPDIAEQLAVLIESAWGTPEMPRMAVPSLASDARAMGLLARQLRASTTPGRAAAQFRYLFELDLRSVLESIHVPTLIIHRPGHPFTTVGMSRQLAAGIAGAREVEVPGNDFWCCTEGVDETLAAIEEFLTGQRRAVDVDRVLATVMFTDIVGSTTSAARLGDRGWTALLDRHDDLARRAVENSGGRLVKSTGDGVLATFDSPGRSIGCALDLTRSLDAAGITIRTGLHTGELERRGEDVGGIAVHIAARVMDAAAAGQVLCSRTVRDLVVGSGHAFVDCGPFDLRGVPEQWQLFSVAG